MAVLIQQVHPGGPADLAGVQAGETLVAINGNTIMDVLDFRFYETDSRLTLTISNAEGKERQVHIRKGQYESLGLEFETYLMDRQHSCRNKCVFCFIDQLPKGMRESLYFKDDDSRLSFLFGNYITLTNLSEHEISRIIKMHISPINVSVHTTNPELRCKMMGNRFAGDSLRHLMRFAEAGVHLNAQLVLCPGINDGPELERTLNDLFALGENLQSIACVPVGLTRYRDSLYPLQPYTRETAEQTLQQIEAFGETFLRERGSRVVYASDEFYLMAGRPIPQPEFYEDFAQLENGVGLLSSLREEFQFALEDAEEEGFPQKERKVTMVTGEGAYPFLNRMLDELRGKCDTIECNLVPVRNDFFGGGVNVAGLLTGQDVLAQLKGRDLGEELLIPSVMLRQQGDVFLDDLSPADLEKAFGVPVHPVHNDGQQMLDAILGRDTSWQNR